MSFSSFQRAVTALTLLFLLTSCQNEQPSATPSPTPAQKVEVRVAESRKGRLEQSYSAVGTLASTATTDVASSVSAQIRDMPLLKNQDVVEGQILATLAPGDLLAQKEAARAAVTEAELNLESVRRVTLPQNQAQLHKALVDAKAAYDNAHATYQRRLELHQKGGISQKDLESTELALINAQTSLNLARKNLEIQEQSVAPNSVEIARSRVAQARERVSALQAQIELAVVKAPISGVVTDQYLFQGDFATQGQKLVSIADLDRMVVKANFPDNLAAKLSRGQSVTIVPQSDPTQEFQGHIVLISRSANLNNRTVETWSQPDNDINHALKIGDAAKVDIQEKRPSSVIVPISAVTRKSPGSSSGVVDVVDANQVAHQVRVTLGASNGHEVEVEEGLSEGQTVIVDGNFNLPDGTAVSAKRSSP